MSKNQYNALTNSLINGITDCWISVSKTAVIINRKWRKICWPGRTCRGRGTGWLYHRPQNPGPGSSHWPCCFSPARKTKKMMFLWSCWKLQYFTYPIFLKTTKQTACFKYSPFEHLSVRCKSKHKKVHKHLRNWRTTQVYSILYSIQVYLILMAVYPQQ